MVNDISIGVIGMIILYANLICGDILYYIYILYRVYIRV